MTIAKPRVYTALNRKRRTRSEQDDTALLMTLWEMDEANGVRANPLTAKATNPNIPELERAPEAERGEY